MQRAAYLFIATYYRVELAIAGQLVQVLGITLQRIDIAALMSANSPCCLCAIL
jgi:hypothetical protein